MAVNFILSFCREWNFRFVVEIVTAYVCMSIEQDQLACREKG